MWFLTIMKIIEDPNKRSPHWRSKWEKDKSLWERNIDIIFSFYRGNQSQHSTALCNTFRGNDVRHLLLLLLLLLLRGTMLTGRAILSFFQGRFLMPKTTWWYSPHNPCRNSALYASAFTVATLLFWCLPSWSIEIQKSRKSLTELYGKQYSVN